jgi:DNA-binding phage protein
MDRQMLIHTLGVVARARMMKLSKDTGITRAGLEI